MPKTTELLAPLTGLRAVAAYSVLVAHAIHVAFNYPGVPPYLGDLAFRIAYFGMSLFFVLSGFVIHYNYASKFEQQGALQAGADFFVARFARLYPLYAVGILVSIPHLPLDVFSDWRVLLAYLTLTQSWFNVQMALFAPFWSVSTECFFYLMFVPLVFLLRPVQRPLRALGIYCAVALAVVFVVLWVFAGPLTAAVKSFHLNPRVSSDAWGWIIYMGPGARILEFIAGTLASMAHARLQRDGIPEQTLRVLRATLVVAPLWCLGLILLPSSMTAAQIQNVIPNFAFAPALAPYLVACCIVPNRVGSLLSSRFAIFAGEISYSIYTWSFSVMALLGASYASQAWGFEAVVNSILKMCAIAFLTTVFAYGSYQIIEVPARRWIRAKGASLLNRTAG